MDIKAVKEFSSSWGFFWNRYRKRMLAAIGASLLLSVLEMFSVSLILPLFSMGFDAQAAIQVPFMDELRALMGYFSLDLKIDVLFFTFMAIWIGKSVVSLFLSIFVNNSTILIAKDLRNNVILSIRDASWRYFNTQKRGEIVNWMTQEIDRCGGVFSVIQTVIVSLFLFVVYILVGVSVNFEIMLALVGLAALGFVLARPMFAMARRAGAGELEGLKDIASDLLQGISGLKAFKAMGRERDLLRALSEANDSFVGASKLKVRAQIFLGFSQEMVFAGAVIAAFVVAYQMLDYPLVEIGFMGFVLLKINTHLTNLLKKFQAVSTQNYGIRKYQERISGFLAHPENTPGHSDYIYPSTIAFKDVSYNHAENSGVNDVSLELSPTGMTLFLGPSGSGKTTLVDLLSGFYKPDSGVVLIGGEDFQNINFRHWRSSIGYVTQTSSLLDDTIRSNVAAFNKDVSDEDVWQALRQAGAEKFVSALPQQLDTSIGEDGSQLSGGEKQRLAIARALAQRPNLLILDEPTAALDTQVEAEIIETIAALSKDICVIVVSHQPAWAGVADRVYEVEAGRVSLRG